MKKECDNICILSPFELPIPAVRGGAVEGLIETIIKNYQDNSNIKLTIVSIFNKHAQKIAKEEYKNINFIFIKKPKIITVIDKIYELFYFLLKLGKKHEYQKKYLWKFFTLYKCRKLLKKTKYDKIIIENSGYLLNVFRNKKIREEYKRKNFFHLHNIVSDKVYLNGLMNSKIIVISEYLKNDIIKRFPKIDTNKIILLKNGIKTDYNFNEFNKLNERKSLKIMDNEIVILFVGRIVKEKGIEELINAINELNNRRIKLLIVGSHNFGKNSKSDFSKKMDIKFREMGNQVIFTGFVSHQDVWKYYCVSDFAVLPSIWEEPAGLTMIEASACGVPIITTNSGGILEYINSNYSIILKNDDKLIENLKNAIIEMTRNYDKYVQLAQKQKENIIRKFDENVYYNNFLKILKNKG